MIIQEISFGMSVEVYPSQWRKASVKGVVGERESDAEALTQAKTFLEDWFNKAYSLPPDANKVYTTGDAFNNTVINREDERLNDLIADQISKLPYQNKLICFPAVCLKHYRL